MTDEEIIAALKAGETLHFGCHGRNSEVMEFMADLEAKGLVKLTDMNLSQETRMSAKWIGETHGG